MGDAKRAADRRQEFISTELTIEDEVGNLIAYRPGIRPWIDCINPDMLGRWLAGRSRHGGRGVGAPKWRSESELRA